VFWRGHPVAECPSEHREIRTGGMNDVGLSDALSRPDLGQWSSEWSSNGPHGAANHHNRSMNGMPSSRSLRVGSGGGSGIRTHDTLAGIAGFKSPAALPPTCYAVQEHFHANRSWPARRRSWTVTAGQAQMTTDDKTGSQAWLKLGPSNSRLPPCRRW